MNRARVIPRAATAPGHRPHPHPPGARLDAPAATRGRRTPAGRRMGQPTGTPDHPGIPGPALPGAGFIRRTQRRTRIRTAPRLDPPRPQPAIPRHSRIGETDRKATRAHLPARHPRASHNLLRPPPRDVVNRSHMRDRLKIQKSGVSSPRHADEPVPQPVPHVGPPPALTTYLRPAVISPWISGRRRRPTLGQTPTVSHLGNARKHFRFTNGIGGTDPAPIGGRRN